MVIAAVIVVALIVTGVGLLRSRERMSESANEREWNPIVLLPAALARDTEFRAAPVRIDTPVSSRSPEEPTLSAAKGTPPAARGVRQVRPGYLSINSRPWAEVSVDGRVVGNTPQIKIRVTPGRHHLLLAREGFQTHSAWVVVPAGGNVRLTDITLTVVTR